MRSDPPSSSWRRAVLTLAGLALIAELAIVAYHSVRLLRPSVDIAPRTPALAKPSAASSFALRSETAELPLEEIARFLREQEPLPPSSIRLGGDILSLTPEAEKAASIKFALEKPPEYERLLGLRVREQVESRYGLLFTLLGVADSERARFMALFVNEATLSDDLNRALESVPLTAVAEQRRRELLAKLSSGGIENEAFRALAETLQPGGLATEGRLELYRKAKAAVEEETRARIEGSFGKSGEDWLHSYRQNIGNYLFIVEIQQRLAVDELTPLSARQVERLAEIVMRQQEKRNFSRTLMPISNAENANFYRESQGYIMLGPNQAYVSPLGFVRAQPDLIAEDLASIAGVLDASQRSALDRLLVTQEIGRGLAKRYRF